METIDENGGIGVKRSKRRCREKKNSVEKQTSKIIQIA